VNGRPEPCPQSHGPRAMGRENAQQPGQRSTETACAEGSYGGCPCRGDPRRTTPAGAIGAGRLRPVLAEPLASKALPLVPHAAHPSATARRQLQLTTWTGFPPSKGYPHDTSLELLMANGLPSKVRPRRKTHGSMGEVTSPWAPSLPTPQ
jgi:hypothetical protein